MKQLSDFKEEIHKCSKCGLCQSVCPIYKVTGNDCTVSRGQFTMLRGLIKGELKMTNKLNFYLSLCLKCGACTKFCPSGINVVDIIAAAKQEYFKQHLLEKYISFVQKNIIFGLIPNLLRFLGRNRKSENFDKKVLYFNGCGGKYIGNSSIVKILNSIGIEVITPNFPCCGISLFTRGDLDSYKGVINEYVKILRKYNIKEIVTSCASCEKTIKDYQRWCDNEDSKHFLAELNIKNIYEYIRENNLKLKLKKPVKVTYHKPCNIENFGDVEWILKNTENLEYIQMNGYDDCCGLNGLSQFGNHKIMKTIFKNKRSNIINSGAKTVLTSCLGCEIALKSYSKNKYKTDDLINFLVKNL